MSDNEPAINQTLAQSLTALKSPAPALPDAEPTASTEPEGQLTVALGNNNYQQFSCNRVACCVITPSGKRVNFTNYEHYTKDPEIVEFITEQIYLGARGFTKGAVVPAEDVNPQSAMKRKIIEEFLLSQKGRDFTSGSVTAEELLRSSSIMSSSQVPTG
jgi:hypothetical protein